VCVCVLQSDISAAASPILAPMTTSGHTATTSHTTTQPDISSVEFGIQFGSFPGVKNADVQKDRSGTGPIAAATPPTTLETVNTFFFVFSLFNTFDKE